MGVIKDLTGMTFGRLTLVRMDGYMTDVSNRKYIAYECQCECGNVKRIRGADIKSGKTTSCGCYSLEVSGNINRTHGKSKTKEYKIWKGIYARCFNKKSSKYSYYGGRGITICDRWKKFENFLEDMGECPEEMSLDRIDVNGNYEPENCRWTDLTTQRYNIRRKSNNSTGRTGVYYKESTDRYHAYIRKHDIQYFLGSFKTFEEAAKVREAAELELYGTTKE